MHILALSFFEDIGHLGESDKNDIGIIRDAPLGRAILCTIVYLFVYFRIYTLLCDPFSQIGKSVGKRVRNRQTPKGWGL